uniref:Uncharacterized protein n=1 Tax=Dinoroseobacter phage vB_DshS_R26L TaxID=3161158 RepID=A0AAU7VGD5_9CAUD
MTQFIAHADTPRTFADKKGATKAIKRDLNKHFEAHGDTLFDIGFEVKEAGESGRFGVVLYCDLTPEDAQKLVGNELSGYVIEPQLKAAPKPKTDAPKKASRRKGQVTVEPTSPLIHCRAGSKQQAIVDKLAAEGGATLDDLREVCVKKDGTAWDDNSIRSALYYDIKDKGYGVRTEFEGDEPRYFIVLPEGYDAPLPAKARKS